MEEGQKCLGISPHACLFLKCTCSMYESDCATDTKTSRDLRGSLTLRLGSEDLWTENSKLKPSRRLKPGHLQHLTGLDSRTEFLGKGTGQGTETPLAVPVLTFASHSLLIPLQ